MFESDVGIASSRVGAARYGHGSVVFGAWRFRRPPSPPFLSRGNTRQLTLASSGHGDSPSMHDDDGEGCFWLSPGLGCTGNGEERLGVAVDGKETSALPLPGQRVAHGMGPHAVTEQRLDRLQGAVAGHGQLPRPLGWPSTCSRRQSRSAARPSAATARRTHAREPSLTLSLGFWAPPHVSSLRRVPPSAVRLA